jgi:restriction system protein
MNEPSIADLKGILRDLDGGVMSGTSSVEALSKLARLLEPLLRKRGYALKKFDGQPGDWAFDFVAHKGQTPESAADELYIAYKHNQHAAVEASQLEALLRAARAAVTKRAMFVINTRFTASAREVVRKSDPAAIELVDIDALHSWVGRLEQVPKVDLGEITIIRRALSRQYINLIAQNPQFLQGIEWREMEHLVAEVFEGLGFSAEVTEGSKDKGRDVILTCRVGSATHKYYIEIKHWRSQQKVGGVAIKHFLSIVVNEEVAGGLFLSTYGYCSNAIESLTEIERKMVRFGGHDKIQTLCKSYQRAQSGIFEPDPEPIEVLYADTI